MGCQGSGSAIPGSTPAPNSALSEAERTLASLKRLSEDAPLYEMYYAGDYGFDEHLRQSSAIDLAKDGFACSCFAALGNPDERLFGRNFDWYEHPALVLFTNPPNGYASISMVDISYLGYDLRDDPRKNPDALLNAPFLPFDGMNAKGLAVGMMAVPHAEGGDDPGKITLDELEMIRLLLDHAGNVSEALELMGKYNVDFGSVPVHYLVADVQGNSALVEFLEGQPVIRQVGNSWQVATNFLVAEEQPKGADSSCWRYNRLYTGLLDKEGRVDDKLGMSLLMGVAQEGEFATRWSWIFDLTRRQAALAFGRDYQHVYEFKLEE